MAEIFDLARKAAKDYVYKLRSSGKISFSESKSGEIPSIHIIRRTFPEVWEDTAMALLGIGQTIHTGYDPTTTGKPYEGEYISFPSMEATVMMHTEEPQSEPRFHKHYLGGGALGFGDYRAEIEGIKDHWMISPDNVINMIKQKRFDEIRDDEKWKYTYHQRLFNYPFIDIEGKARTINQIESVINKLVREPLSKSAQAITCDPRWDHNDGQMGARWKDYDSPCLQRFWFRLHPFREGYKLNTNSHWRSRCHLKGVPSNKDATEWGLIETIRIELEKRMGVPIYRGRDVDISDSLHLYGHYFDTGLQGLDAEAYLQDVFRVAEGESIEKRLIIPGTPLHTFVTDSINQEYKWRKEHPEKH